MKKFNGISFTWEIIIWKIIIVLHPFEIRLVLAEDRRQWSKIYIFSVWPCTWASRQPTICYISFSSKKYLRAFSLIRGNWFYHIYISETVPMSVPKGRNLNLNFLRNCKSIDILRMVGRRSTSQWTELNDIANNKWTIVIARMAVERLSAFVNR